MPITASLRTPTLRKPTWHDGVTVMAVTMRGRATGIVRCSAPGPAAADAPMVNTTARQCCRAAAAPRRCAPVVRVGLPPGMALR